MAQENPVYRKRLKTVYFCSLLLIILLGVRAGYMEIIYHSGKQTLSEMKNEVEVLNSTLIEDVQNKFDVNLEGYQEFTYNELADTVDSDKSEMSILALENEKCAKECVGKPSAFLNKNKGYVFYRQQNGKNVLLKIQEKNNVWTETARKTKD